jgi:hypothetical protein
VIEFVQQPPPINGAGWVAVQQKIHNIIPVLQEIEVRKYYLNEEQKDAIEYFIDSAEFFCAQSGFAEQAAILAGYRAGFPMW